MVSARQVVRRFLKLPTSVRRRLRALGLVDGKRHGWMSSNIGSLLGTVHMGNTPPCTEPVTSADGFELVCSYSWRRRTGPQLGRSPLAQKARDDEDKSACRRRRQQQQQQQKQPPSQVFVPGEAPRVMVRKLPAHFGSSTRFHTLRDYNVAYMPNWPFEPMFRSLEIMRPGWRLDDVDIIVNRNNLSKLLRLVRGVVSEPFRLNLAMIKNTLLVNPAWQTLKESRHANNSGRLFEENFTVHSPELRDACSHHRAIVYNIGPIRCLVLCEVDACFTNWKPSYAIRNWHLRRMDSDDDDAVRRIPSQHPASSLHREGSFFRSLGDGRFQLPPPRYSPHTTVVRGGKGTLSSQSAELISFASRSPSLKYQQMWLGRTPYLIAGRHVKNTFTGVQVRSSWPRLLLWEERMRDPLHKLASAIQMLKDLTSSAADRQAIAIATKHEDDRSLKVFEPQEKPSPPLPPGFETRFWT